MTPALTPADIDQLDDSPYYELVVIEPDTSWYGVGWFGIGRDGKEYGTCVATARRVITAADLVELRRQIAANHAELMVEIGQPLDFTRRP